MLSKDSLYLYIHAGVIFTYWVWWYCLLQSLDQWWSLRLVHLQSIQTLRTHFFWQFERFLEVEPAIIIKIIMIIIYAKFLYYLKEFNINIKNIHLSYIINCVHIPTGKSLYEFARFIFGHFTTQCKDLLYQKNSS